MALEVQRLGEGGTRGREVLRIECTRVDVARLPFFGRAHVESSRVEWRRLSG